VFEAAVRAAETTDGAFNPFLYPLSLAWGFTDDGIVPPEAPPDGETLAGLLAHTAVSGVELTETGVIKKDGEMKADLGGIAKGYAAEYCIRIAEKHGAKNALVSISGNIYALGRYKTGAADRPFRIAVTDPRAADNHNAYFCKAAVENTSVSISGDYHRYFMREGKRYSHILSPYTGRPAESGVMSVAVLGADGAASDAYATAIFVMGTEQGLAFCEKNGVTAIVMGEDYRYAVAGDISISDVYEKYEQTLY
jgi:thiamine biosynthesis lipoprotein